MRKTKCQNPECNKTFNGRNYKSRTSKFCSNPCSARHRQLFPELYQNIKKFEVGQTAWNKGKRALKLGDIIIRRKTTKAGAKRDLKYAFIGYNEKGKPRHIRNDRYIWITHNGPIPKGYTIWHKDGRTLNDDINNLEIIPMGEALSRYSLAKKKNIDLKNPHHITKVKEGFVRGDIRIQNQLYDMVKDRCMSIALKYSKNEAEAEEILSDAFIKIFKSISKVDSDKKQLSGWISKVVVNTAIDHLRKTSKQKHITNSVDESEHGEINHVYNKLYIDEDFGERIDGQYVNQIIDELSPVYKLVFNMRVMDGLSHIDISKKLGISEGTSKSNFSKAKKAIREKLLALAKNDDSYKERLGNYNIKLEML